MRLERLGLVRYGRFTGRVLDFGARPEAGPDLHLVYGPNEAGKSTTLAAWLDLLYGIGAQSPYGFLHPYATMRLEASLELEGRPRVFARIKRPQNSLLGPDEQPLPDAAILSELGGIGRDAYRTMFSLDDDTLEAGGESILASRGDLGQLLFSASAGLAALGQRLERLKQEADSFYKPSARKTGLAELKARLATLKEERDAIDTLASVHARLVEEEKTSRDAYGAATAERGRLQAEQDAIARQIGALPRLGDLKATSQRLAQLAALPEPPPGFAAELPGLQQREVQLATRRAGLQQEASALQHSLAALAEDPAALAEADTFDALDDLRARHSTAARDLPARQLERAETERSIAALLVEIGRPGATDPRALLIGAAPSTGLMELVEARSGISARLAAAETEVKAARAALEEAQARLGAGGPVSPMRPEGLAMLASVLKSLRAADVDGERQRALRARDAAVAALDEALAALAPWHGDAAALALLIVPDAATLADWKSGLDRAESEVTLKRADVDRLITEVSRQQAESDALDALAGPGTEAETAAARLAREAAWTEHRGRLDAASAAAFEAAMRRDDVATGARLLGVTAGARRTALAQSLAIVRSERDSAANLLAAAEQRLTAERDRIAAMVEAVVPSLMARSGLGGFATWLRRREQTLESRAAAQAAEAAFANAERAVESAKEALLAALHDAGLTPDGGSDLGRLRVLAEDAAESAAAAAGLAKALKERQRDFVRREAERSEAAAVDADWQAAWRQALAGTWLDEADPAVGAMRAILTALQGLAAELAKAASLSDRIAKMELDQKTYRATLERLADALGQAAEPDTAVLAARLGERIAAARANENEHRALSQRLAANAEAETAIAGEEAIFRRQSNAMMLHFGVETLADVAVALAAVAERTTLEKSAAAAERDIIAALDVADITDAEGVLAATDRDALTARRADLQRQLADLDQRCEQLYAAHSVAFDRLERIGGDGTVAAIEVSRRTVLAEIEDGAIRTLRLRAGIGAAEAALRLYRERHRSQMMARASEAFRTISRGAYAGLTSQADKDGERLIALVAGGGSKAAAELSKGTRFQLYLALRVAGYFEFAASRRAVPFIADDIMESFDDFRAEEAFRLFAGMAEVGQVIYLTHHQHLIPIAENVCPTIRVHRLAAD